jgi:hypothetical protein
MKKKVLMREGPRGSPNSINSAMTSAGLVNQKKEEAALM